MQIEPATVIQTVVALLLVGALQSMNDFKKKVQSWQDRMDVAMFGPNGKNGVYGTVGDHEQRLRALEAPKHD